MKKSFGFFVIAFALTALISTDAQAAFCDENCPVRGFFETTGKVVSKVMPWNWGK